MDDQVLRPAVGGPDAGYLLEFLQDGVFVTIYPSDGAEMLFELSDVRQSLQENGVIDYDIIELSKIIREAAGQPRKIADEYVEVMEEENEILSAEEKKAAEQEEIDESEQAGLIIDVSRDQMIATVRYDTTKGSGLPSAAEVKEALSEKGVVFGINEEAIEKGVKSLTPFVAAEGKQVQHGDNARIERKFDLSNKNKPKIDEYNRANYKDMGLFVLAKKGDLLAVRIPQTEGVPGKNIFGIDVPARTGRPIPIPQGKNTEVRNENELYATMSGQIVDNPRRIDIDPHLEIRSSVGAGTGNIDFVGGVSIKGNVEAGFIVKATGDIEIGGMVNGADVSGRNILIKGGIVGQNRGLVKATEDVRALFAENANIEAGRDVVITDTILHSNVRAGKCIYVEERKGIITGGSVAASEEIRCKLVGNPAAVVTRLSVGVDPTVQQKYTDLCKECKADRARLKQITQMLNTLGKIDVSRLPQQRIDQINALTRSQFPLAGKIKRAEKEIIELEEAMGRMSDGKIRVTDTIYPGVRISINSIMMNVQSTIRRCLLTVKDDRINIGTY
ncbi:hypothetical protein SELR_05680 [Selenomonas ruminantium subsp. lactilytica TAM6421]|uniref:Flagellar Assembly Protein A N-terminal region domain-containing protein n=1 Tax=Selenomonas ruminantium subsp. lactilytica (strain NBRC 103574 / TAM6421) TaxID=927704 RepID=I0GND9_SELRL|nr:FapA family protein [Selenomonas ruminantium]BAL82276.1 hypothetical protein SELR_05680 [Selenomonas ruminantium subsp. lactilytica TAM6421]